MVDELLVHISAPTTRQTDELYRSLAEAYIEFDPQGSQISRSRQIHVSSQPAPSRLEEAEAPDQRDSFQGTTEASILSASKDSYGSFPSHLSFDGLKTRKDAGGRWNYDAGEDDLPPTTSPLAQPRGTHHNGKGRRSLSSSSIKRNKSHKQVPDSTDDVDMGFIEDTQVAADDFPSQPQDSYMMESDGASENDTIEGQMQDGTIKASVAATPDVTPDVKDNVPERRRSMRLKTASRVAETPISATSSAVANLQEPTESDDALRPSTLEFQYATEQKESEESSQIAEPIDFSKLQIDVFPPEPKVSTARPGTLPSQITPPLATLKEQNPTRFKPVRILKKPKPDDRGYWLVGCGRWNTQLQQVFWNNICAQVSSGHLGWGVTLYRESHTSRSLGKVKLYCWGEIVEHTWLVLWLCSKGKICGSGLEWIDADGNAAFIMS